MRNVASVLFVSLVLATSVLSTGCRRSAAVLDAEERQDQALQRARSLRIVPEQAVEAYRGLLDNDPRMAVAHLDLALLLHDNIKDYVGAIYHYRRYLALRPDADKAAMVAARIQDATRRFGAQAQGETPATNKAATGMPLTTAMLLEENAALKLELARLTQEVESSRAHGDRDRVDGGEAAAAADVASKPQLTTTGPRKPPAERVSRARTHKVKAKETLSSIAESVYGDRSQWKRIFEANLQQMKGDPNRLREGMELTIP